MQGKAGWYYPEPGLPSEADLDVIAEEEAARQATADEAKEEQATAEAVHAEEDHA